MIAVITWSEIPCTLIDFPSATSSQDQTPYPPPETFSTPLPTLDITHFPTPSPLPGIGYDLIYMGPTGPNNYELRYWDHRTGLTKVLVTEETTSSANQDNLTLSGNVSAYSISRDGKKMVFLRVVYRQMKSPFYEFIYFDFQNKHINPLIRFDVLINQSAISPDGQWVGYLQDGNLYFFAINDPSFIFERGSCEGRCLNFIWSPDGKFIAASKFIASSNEYGEYSIWISVLSSNTTRLLASNRMLWVRNEITSVLALPAWSPDSRFLLAWEPNTENGEWYVMDVQNDNSTKIPNSFQYPQPTERSFWLQDGRLCVVRSGDVNRNLVPSVEIWQATPEKENLITLEQTILIPVRPELYPISPIQLDDGRIAFVLVDTLVSSPSNESGLYVIGSDNIPARISDVLPLVYNPEGANAYWSPDGNGVIYYDLSSGTQLSILLNGGLRPAIPPNSCCFTWLE